MNQSKVFHVVMDDVVDRDLLESDEWHHELTQTDIGISRVKVWARQTGFLGPDDLLISSDVDEVMSAGALEALRWCETHQVRLVCLLPSLCLLCRV